MASMYEKIMDLPLFKGIGKDHVSQFLERTHLEFCNYKRGELVASMGESVENVMFIMSGELSLLNRIGSSGIVIEERLFPVTVIGADRLFGLDKTYPCNIVSNDKTSVMRFGKSHYLRLLDSDPIYKLNFFNYLSLRAQRGKKISNQYWGGDIHSRISQLILMTIDPSTDSVVLRASDSALARYCNVSEELISQWKMNLGSHGIALCDGVDISIPDIRHFVDVSYCLVSKRNPI